MRSTLSPRSSGREEEGGSAPCHPGEGLRARGHRREEASQARAYPLESLFPCRSVPGPVPVPSLLGGVIWEPDVELQMWSSSLCEGERGRMACGVRQLQTLEFGLHHSHMHCVISGKFLNFSEPWR